MKLSLFFMRLLLFFFKSFIQSLWFSLSSNPKYPLYIAGTPLQLFLQTLASSLCNTGTISTLSAITASFMCEVPGRFFFFFFSFWCRCFYPPPALPTHRLMWNRASCLTRSSPHSLGADTLAAYCHERLWPAAPVAPWNLRTPSPRGRFISTPPPPAAHRKPPCECWRCRPSLSEVCRCCRAAEISTEVALFELRRGGKCFCTWVDFSGNWTWLESFFFFWCFTF